VHITENSTDGQLLKTGKLKLPSAAAFVLYRSP